MKILFISPLIGDAFGQERALRDSSILLKRSGQKIFFLAEHCVGNLPPNDGYQLIPNLANGGLLPSGTNHARIQHEVFQYLDKVKPDIVHLIEQIDAPLTRKIASQYPTILTSHTVATTCPASHRSIQDHKPCPEASGWKCLLFNKKYHCLKHFHGNLRKAHAVFQYQKKKESMSALKFVIANSRYIESLLKNEGFPLDKLRLIYNPVFSPSKSTSKRKEKNLIVCAARLTPIKGIHHLIRALNKIKTTDWTLNLCGEGSMKNELMELVKSNDLTHRIHFKGKVSYQEMSQMISKASLYVQPNIGPESFGLSVAEASSMGIPVITSQMPSLDEIVIHGLNGLLTPPGDEDALSDSIQSVLKDKVLRHKLSKWGPTLIRERFSPKIHLEKTLTVYDESLKGYLKVAA